MKKRLSLLLFLVGCIIIPGIFVKSATAQVTPDGTTNTTVNADGNDFTIQNGDRAGNNLFHSFQDFSVPTDGSAFFDNAPNIANILSRVTGGNISNIDGLIRANGTANLFLINPAGIIFGQGARLDLGGSFYGSSASSILFEDGEFSATDLENPPLLTINAPIGLGFRDEPGEIINRSFAQNSAEEFVGLEVLPGNNLAFIGGNINFETGLATASGGNIELGGLSQAGTVGINPDGSLSFPEEVTKADINLSNLSAVDARGTGGGSVTVNARNLNLVAGELASSFILAGIRAESTSAEAQAGDVTINVAENITLDDSSIGNQVEPGGVGNSGKITINTGSIEAMNGGLVSASTFGQGNAGSVDINARDITFDGEDSNGISSGATSQVAPDAVGNAGGVTISTANLNLTNGGLVDASTLGQGDAGSVDITARDITFDGEDSNGISSGATSQVAPDAVGNAGGVTISTSNLTLTNGGLVDASTFGQGNAGQVTINVSDTISVDGENPSGDEKVGGIFSTVGDGAIGNAEGVEIITGNLTLTNAGTINASTFGQGNAGSVNITATGDITFDGEDSEGFASGAASQVTPNAVGNAGGVTISTANLTLTNGGLVDASTFGQGNAGSVDITATEDLTFDGETSAGFASGAASQVNPGAVGNAGGVTISTANLTLTNGGRVDASTLGQGDAGSVDITATEDLTFDGETSAGIPSGATSEVNPNAVGNAGGVTISTANLTLTNGGRVDASTLGQGNAGSVDITATEDLTFDGETSAGISSSGATSQVAPDAVGDAGGVTISTANLTLTNGGRVDASTLGQGDAGSVDITATEDLTFDGETSDFAGISSVVGSEAVGSGGEITITTGNLTLANGGLIATSTFGGGDAGDVNVNATESIVISGVNVEGDIRSGLYANALISNGNGGNVNVVANQLTIEDGGTIDVGNFNDLDDSEPGTGEPGNINIEANSINLSNEGRIVAATQAETGNSANINLQVDNSIILEGNSLISAQAFNNANGGNLTIDTNFIVAFPNGNNDIIANAQQGNGGNINITAESLFGIEERPLNPNTNDINASSEFGLDGSISIFTPDINAIQTDIELPNNLVESEETVAQACQSDRISGQASGITIKGKGGIPAKPTEPIDSEAILVQGKTTTPKPPVQSPDIPPLGSNMGNILPARGIIKTEDGQIILTAYSTDKIDTRTPQISLNCS